MSKDLVKLNWDLVKQADDNASRHDEVQQKVANIGEYLQDPDIQNALLAGGAGALGGGVMGAFGEKDDDESRAWKILKNVLGYGGAAALMGYGAGPASRALGGPDDPLGGVKDWGKEQYDNFVDKTPKVNHQGPEAGVPPLLDPNTQPAAPKPFNPTDALPEFLRPPAPMPQGQGPLRPELLPKPKTVTGSATDLVKRAGYWSEAVDGLKRAEGPSKMEIDNAGRTGPDTPALAMGRDLRRHAGGIAQEVGGELADMSWQIPTIPSEGGYEGLKNLYQGGVGGAHDTLKKDIGQAGRDAAHSGRYWQQQLQNLFRREKASSANNAVKQSGYWSEVFGGLNPINYYGGTLVGQGAALATPTRNMREQAEADEDMWKNLLVPGVSGYNSAKRLGHAIRGPELKAIKARQEAEAEHVNAHAEDEQHREEDEKSKEAGYWSEQAAMLNPLNYPALPFAAGAAAMTDTRNLDEQAEADKSTWSNFLVPGKGSYNAFKRLGTSIRGPEITKERAELANEKRRDEQNKYDKDDKKDDDKKDEEKEGAAIGAYFAKVAVNASKWEDKSRKKKRSKVRISESGQAHLSKKKKKKVKSAADNSPKVKQATPPARRKVTPPPARPKTPTGTTRSA